jgi:FAD dependent oxidoreductase
VRPQVAEESAEAVSGPAAVVSVPPSRARADQLQGTGQSWWLDDAMSADGRPRPALEGRERADVCVVGGGYTGLWTALRIKELDPSLDVALVEAGVCGWGQAAATAASR